METNVMKPRVNASLLSKFHDKLVTVMGIAKQPDGDGMAFKVESSDKADVTVRLPEPLQEYLEGLIEVQGKVNNRNELECTSYVLFPKEQADTFDMASYNKVVEFLDQTKFYENKQ